MKLSETISDRTREVSRSWLISKVALLEEELEELKSRKPSYGKVVQALTILECENDELKRLAQEVCDEAKEPTEALWALRAALLTEQVT